MSFKEKKIVIIWIELNLYEDRTLFKMDIQVTFYNLYLTNLKSFNYKTQLSILYLIYFDNKDLLVFLQNIIFLNTTDIVIQ